LTQQPAIEVAVPAAIGFVPLLRKAAATSCPPKLASRMGDVRLAVSEACNLLLRRHAPATRLVLGVTTEDERISLRIHTDAAMGDVPPSGHDDSWSWRLLVSVSDLVRFRATSEGPTIELGFFASRPDGVRQA
jgi:hypothetical protein